MKATITGDLISDNASIDIQYCEHQKYKGQTVLFRGAFLTIM